MKINYLTTNKLKFSIAQNYFRSLADYELVQHDFDTPEIQDASCEVIAGYSAAFAAKTIGEPCIKLDVGFYIELLGGFPGPFVKYINDWLSEEEVLAMLEGKDNRAAYFLDATAIGFPDGTSKVFSKKYHGTIALRNNYSSSDWPMNSLFIPDGYNIPLGSMDDESQEAYWGDGAWPDVVAYLEREPGKQ